MTVFFTADTHFGHAGARALYRRPFADVASMNAALEAAWNNVVGPTDEVWHLGDFAIGSPIAEAAAMLARLHGRKRLVTGNNDPPEIASLSGWVSAASYVEIEEEGVALVLCHYAFRTWRGAARGSINLHGHSHGRLKPLGRQADVGVDSWNFRPISLREVAAFRRWRLDGES